MKRIKIEEIFRRLDSSISEPRTELKFESPFHLLIAVILSAQTTDKAVNKVTSNLFKIAPCANSLAMLNVKKVEKIIRGIGLYKKKAEFIVKTSKMLLEKHNGKVPRTRKELENLPGVGRKTAGVVLNTIYLQGEIAVDTHVFRVSRRLGIANSTNLNKVEEELRKIVPNHYKKIAHNLLLLHGRYTCKAQRPHCSSCLLIELCNFGKRSDMVNY